MTELTEYPNLTCFYYAIWGERPHISFISGKPIYSFSPVNFAHVLAKGQGKYPKFKFYKKNVVLLTFEEHTLYDQGTKDQREKYAKKNPACDWGKLDRLKEQLILEYNAL